MSEPFLGQIRMVGFNFAPRGWALCDGQILPINQNQALFSLLGTTYGGDGRTTFALPDLRGRVPIHVGNGGFSQHDLGTRGGEETHTLSAGEMPNHTHAAQGSGQTANLTSAANAHWAAPTGVSGYAASADGAMHSSAISNAGGNQAHENMQPYLVLNFVIALQGLFPSRN